MGVHVPHIVVECTGTSSVNQNTNSNRRQKYDSNRLSTFTSDLLMWSPSSSNHSSFTDLQVNDDKSNYRQSSPTSSTPQTIISDVGEPPRHSTSGDSGYHETLPSASAHSVSSYETVNVLPMPLDNGIESVHGYEHRHSHGVVYCILCGLESYRRFQVRMGWPHYLEYPDFNSFTLTFPDLCAIRHKKIYPHLTIEDNNFEMDPCTVRSSSTMLLLSQKDISRHFIRRIWRRMHRCIFRLGR